MSPPATVIKRQICLPRAWMRSHFKGGADLSEENHAGLAGTRLVGMGTAGRPPTLHQPMGLKWLTGNLGDISLLALLPELVGRLT